MATLARRGVGRERRRRLGALALSLAVNGALLGVIAIRVGPVIATTESPVVEVTLLRRPASQAARTAKPRLAPHRTRQPRSADAAPVAVEIPDGAAGPVRPSPPPGPPIEPQWRLSTAQLQHDEIRGALRRTQPRMMCAGQLEGTLTTEEKEFCLRYWGANRPPRVD